VILRAGGDTWLRSAELADAEPIFALVEANRAHLRRWLGWVDAIRGPEQIRTFLEGVIERERAGTSLELVIEHRDEIAGICGFRTIDLVNRAAELGYWLRADREGRGIVTRCCRALLERGFGAMGLNRIALLAATDNARSVRVAERLEFRLEGVLRETEWRDDHFEDHAVYALLARDTISA